jgi:hypothetical protein
MTPTELILQHAQSLPEGGVLSPREVLHLGSRAPAPRNVVEALAARTGEAVVVHGAASANALGLNQQVPIREVYLTTGRTRKLQVGRSEVIIRQAPRWMFARGSRPAGTAVRALAWLGRDHAQDSIDKLHHSLPAEEWQALAGQRAIWSLSGHPGVARRGWRARAGHAQVVVVHGESGECHRVAYGKMVIALEVG